ncbi:MAG: hypothetical protein ACR2NB_06885 [Solirubrobacteraceae bacterium]
MATPQPEPEPVTTSDHAATATRAVGADHADSRAVRLITSPRTRLAILALVLIVAAIVAFTVGTPSRSSIRDTVDSAGVAGPLVYAGIYIALTVLLVPGVLLTAAGGAVFGIAAATALTAVNATSAPWSSSFLGRRLGRYQV